MRTDDERNRDIDKALRGADMWIAIANGYLVAVAIVMVAVLVLFAYVLFFAPPVDAQEPDDLTVWGAAGYHEFPGGMGYWFEGGDIPAGYAVLNWFPPEDPDSPIRIAFDRGDGSPFAWGSGVNLDEYAAIELWMLSPTPGIICQLRQSGSSTYGPGVVIPGLGTDPPAERIVIPVAELRGELSTASVIYFIPPGGLYSDTPIWNLVGIRFLKDMPEPEPEPVPEPDPDPGDPPPGDPVVAAETLLKALIRGHASRYGVTITGGALDLEVGGEAFRLDFDPVPEGG